MVKSGRKCSTLMFVFVCLLYLRTDVLDVSDCHLSLSPLVADNVNNRLASDKRVHKSCKPNKRRLLKERNLEKCPGRAGQASHSKTWSDEKSYKRNYKKNQNLVVVPIRLQRHTLRSPLPFARASQSLSFTTGEEKRRSSAANLQERSAQFATKNLQKPGKESLSPFLVFQ